MLKRRRPNDPSIASQTPPEVHPLIARCLVGSSPEPFAEVRKAGLWEYVAAEACDAGVGGLLLDRAEQADVRVPASAARQMRAYREHVAAANAYKLENVQRVLARLQMAKVPFLLLKGIALNATMYDAGQRPMTDVDILIHETDAAIAHKVLGNVGCRPGAELVREDFYPKYYCEREYFTRRRPSVKIDLHCRPFHVLRYGRTVPASAMWNNAREVRVGGLTALMPGDEEMLIHLAVHAACHGNTEIRWLHDVYAWIRRCEGQIDVASAADKCRRWRIALPFNRALRAASKMFDVHPAEAKSRTDRMLKELVEATDTFAGPLDRLALAGANLYPISPPLHLLCNALTAPGVRFRMGYLAATLLPDPSHLGQLYRRRHAGWQLVAHAIRAARCLTQFQPR